MVTPEHSGYVSSKARPYMWAIGSMDTSVSSGVALTLVWAYSTVAVKLSYFSMTPFGALVVPEV